MFPLRIVLFMIVALSVWNGGSAFAADVTYTGVSGGSWATGSNWSSNAYPTTGDQAILNKTANLMVALSNNIRAIRIGTGGTGVLNISADATLSATSNSNGDSHLGDQNGNSGTVNQTGGVVSINRLEIGRNSSTGVYNLHAGSLTVIRESGGISLHLGTDIGKTTSGNGSLRISGGALKTRAGVYLGSTTGGIGRFHVEGSHATTIGIGSEGSVDGSWFQNAGSVLSVAIDHSATGVTPIFIDEVGNDGGGDVTFASGALLDVRFTGAFVNGRTFTVMQWEGNVTNNGLQFAPGVDTSIWSFNVDAANKRLTVTAAGAPYARTFVHPGLSHKLSDLQRMRDMVAAGIDPWASTYAQFKTHARAQYTYTVGNSPSYTTLSDSNRNFFINDGTAAYYNALMWMITGDTRHADKSVEILNAWSGLTRNELNLPLDNGRFWRVIEAAEIMKSTYTGWAPADVQKFKDMLVYPGYSNTTVPTSAISNSNVTLYWRLYQGDPIRHGNQGLFAMRVMMAMGVFLDNEIMYERALRYLQGAPHRSDDLAYDSGPPITSGPLSSSNIYYDEYSNNGLASTIPDYGYNEVIHNYIWNNGQGQESSRDQAHALAGTSTICTMAEIAWSQGDDLYGHLDNRPLLGLEHYYRYNLSYANSFPDQTTPWEPTVENGEFIQRRDRSGRWFSLRINPYLAGDIGEEFRERGKHNLQPVYEMNLGHYRDRMKLPGSDYKWMERGLALLITAQGYEQEGTVTDHPGWGGLKFRRVSPGDPIRGFSGIAPVFAMNELPATIEAENYDHFTVKGEGYTYHDLTPTNTGGSYRTVDGVDISPDGQGDFALSSIEAGEWVTYTVSVPSTGNYDISIRYAASASGGQVRLNFGGTDVTGDVAIPFGAPASTGPADWRELVIASNVSLTKGVQSLKLSFSGASNAFLLDSLTVDRSDQSLVAHWKFDEKSGTVAYDGTGHGHNGTINNAAWVTREGGGALSFNGSSSNVTLPGSAFSSVGNEITIALWAYGGASLPNQSSVFYASKSGGGSVLNVHLPFSDSMVYWDASNSAQNRISKTATSAEYKGSWAHWVFTKNASTGTMKIYRNGTLWHSGTSKTAAMSGIVSGIIGSQSGQLYYTGSIDDVRLYNVELSSSEISNMYRGFSVLGLGDGYTMTTSKSSGAPTVSNSDLAQTQYLSSSATGGDDVASRHAELFSGVIGNESSGTGDAGVVRMSSANTVTVNFDISVNTLGYNLTRIDSYFGWNTLSGGRSNQGYKIIVTFIDNTTATLAGPFHWQPNSPASFWTTVSFNPSGSGVLASGVKAVTFDITQDANAGGAVAGREIDIFGTPTVSPYKDYLWQAGDSLAVTMTSATGVAGTDWSFLDLDCMLVLDPSLTAGSPFLVTLSAPTIPFDNQVNQSWRIVSADSISGTFAAGKFTVDASAFAANNPLAGGTFGITNIGNDLYLNFTAATALANWRFANFGTYDNTGTAADGSDFDFDGILNLIEYGTGSDPKVSSPSPLKIQPAGGGTGLEATFNRIVDPALSYLLEGTADLSSVSWDPIWSGTGTEAGQVVVPESEWPAEPRYFLRLRVSH